MAIGDRRKLRKAKAQKPKHTKKRKPKQAKYVSTGYTLTSDPKVYTGGEGLEHSFTSSTGTSTHGKRTKVKNFIKDMTGKMFRVKDTYKAVGTPVTPDSNDGTVEATMNRGETQKAESDDQSKKYPSKVAGTKVNEVYKLRKWGTNQETGKDKFEVDIRRRVTQSNRANDLQLDNYGNASNQRLTERDHARTMEVEKYRGTSGATASKNTANKVKKYVSKADLGGTRTLDFQPGTFEGDPMKEKKKLTPGSYKEVASHKNTKREMRDQGYKVISDKRYDRIARRQGMGYKDNKMAQGMNQAAGGMSGTKDSYNSGLKGKQVFREGIDRLFHGEWKRSDLYRRNK